MKKRIKELDDSESLCKQEEEALRESEGRYRSLAINIPDVLWTTDCRGHIAFISPNVENVYGYTPEKIYEAGDHLWFGRIHPEDIKKVKEAYGASPGEISIRT